MREDGAGGSCDVTVVCKFRLKEAKGEGGPSGGSSLTSDRATMVEEHEASVGGGVIWDPMYGGFPRFLWLDVRLEVASRAPVDGVDVSHDLW